MAFGYHDDYAAPIHAHLCCTSSFFKLHIYYHSLNTQSRVGIAKIPYFNKSKIQFSFN